MGRPRKELTGKRFGRLTVLEFVETQNRRTFWRCTCECGNTTIVSGSNLSYGSTRSCGCLHRETVRSVAGHCMRAPPPLRGRVDPLIIALRQRRYDLKLSQAALAKRMGYSKRYLLDLEQGRASPRLTFITDWAQALGMQVKLESR